MPMTPSSATPGPDTVVKSGADGKIDADWLPPGAGAPIAADVPFTPAGNLASADVQSALEELDAEKATPANITSAVSTHAGASDPHGDRSFATAAIATHAGASDPHGDRAAAAAADTAAIAAHNSASDPHGDRAAATTAIATHAALTTVHGISSYGATLVDDANAAAARATLGLGTAAVVDTGTGSGNAIIGNDARLTDARTPTAHAASHAGGGTDAIATAVASGAAGLLSGTDKQKLDDATASNTASKLMLRDSNGRAQVADPLAAQDIASRAYVDSVAAGLDVKPSVKCATTGNITLSGEQTLDGILTSASRVLVRAQTAPAENGIYVSAAGAWARATDMDAWAEVPGSFVFVEEGSTYADCAFVATANAGGTIGSTSITWSQFGAAGTYTAGTGLTLVGTQFAADFGSTAGKITEANDARLSDTRTPTNNTVTNAKLVVGAVTDDKASLAVKPACTVVATTNQALTGTPTIDTIPTAAGSLILCTAQTSGAENGPWVAAAGAWSRPNWYPSGGTTQSFAYIITLIRLGAANGGLHWRMTTTGPITIDTTATVWSVTTIANAGIAGLGTLATQSGTFSGTHSGTSSGTNTGDQTLSDATITTTDITTNNATTGKHGFLKKLSGNATDYMGGDGNWSVVASILRHMQGDGSDGSLHVTAGTTTLSASKQYSDITVDAGCTLDSRGVEVRCSGTCTINGTWSCNGANGSNGSGASGGGVGSAVSAIDIAGTIVGTAGASGTTGAGAQASASAAAGNSWCGATGGNGGASGLGSGGAGVTSRGSGAATQRGSQRYYDHPMTSTNNLTGGGGGTGGGSGGGDGTGSGGGGGGGGHGGGVLYGCVKDLVVGATGVIQAAGGNGGTGGNGGGTNCGGGGGGAGGGGGQVMLCYETLTVTAGGAINAAAGTFGTGGSKTGTGVAGSVGTAGATGKVIRYCTLTGVYANSAI